MTVLHQWSRSVDSERLVAMVAYIGVADSLLLTGEAVSVALTGSEQSTLLKELADSGRLFVLEPDLRSRYLNERALIDGIRPVDYDGWVVLTERHDTFLNGQ